ncbi:putative lipoprotein YbbD precursor [Paenibacillus sp. P1XP2]|nr:putative lipoprotein YbbD precursor [Paenibacillus sp. P1XP2]
MTRMPKEFAKVPTAKAIGSKNSEALSQGIGAVLGRELSGFGLNMDFAPVLDINSNPNNPVIGDRSFGNKADVVSRLGIARWRHSEGRRRSRRQALSRAWGHLGRLPHRTACRQP